MSLNPMVPQALLSPIADLKSVDFRPVSILRMSVYVITGLTGFLLPSMKYITLGVTKRWKCHFNIPPKILTPHFRPFMVLVFSRFGFIENDPSKSSMYTIHVPRVQGKKKSSYLTRWNSLKFTTEKTVCTGTDALSAINIR